MTGHRKTYIAGHAHDIHGYIRGASWAVIIAGTCFIGYVIGRLT